METNDFRNTLKIFLFESAKSELSTDSKELLLLLLLLFLYSIHWSYPFPVEPQEFEFQSWPGVLDATLCDKFVNDLRQVSGFLQVLWFPPPIKLPRYNWNIVEIDIIHHNPNPWTSTNYIWKVFESKKY